MNSTVAKILKKPITSAILAIVIGFDVAAIILLLAGYDPGGSFAALFAGALSKPKYISNVIIKATPLLLCGISVAFAFRVGLFNIGAEGQYIVGTIAATIVGILVDLPAPLEIPLVICVGTLAGAGLGALAEGKVRDPRGYHLNHVQLDCTVPVQLCGISRYLSPAEFHGILSNPRKWLYDDPAELEDLR